MRRGRGAAAGSRSRCSATNRRRRRRFSKRRRLVSVARALAAAGSRTQMLNRQLGLVHDRRAARRRWHGRGLSRARHEARSRRRDQDPAVALHRRSRAPRPLRARSAAARDAQSSAHRRDLRPRRSRRRHARWCSSSSRGRRWPIAWQRGPLPIAEALAIARQIAEALEAAHEKGIVHRDLKPANIVCKAATPGVVGDVRAKVLDFGLAKTMAVGPERRPDRSGRRTRSTARRDGRILGTPAYMSPEQARGQAVDKRTDIWAFGCVLLRDADGPPRVRRRHDVRHVRQRFWSASPTGTRCPPTTPARVRTLLRAMSAKGSAASGCTTSPTRESSSTMGADQLHRPDPRLMQRRQSRSAFGTGSAGLLPRLLL